MSESLAAGRQGWLTRLRAGLTRSSNRLSEGIAAIFARRRLDDEALEALEELLITADLGPATAARLTAALARARFDGDVTPSAVRAALAARIAEGLAPLARPLEIDPAHRPHVVLFVGVNGTGKTTTIGKIANRLRGEGRSVRLVAADTFRAAGVSQLQEWGARAGCPVITGRVGGDPAGLVYDALSQASAEGAEALLIDTAGRLQTKADLMAELEKIVRVARKVEAGAPHDVVLVLDATTGQNAHSQVERFAAAIPVSGLIVTKLDGSARGGVVVGLAERFALPVHAVGVGEGLDDLRPFEARAFANGLLGLDR